MKKRNYTVHVIVLVVIVLVVMLAWPRLNDPNKTVKAVWKEVGVGCLSEGHTNISLHIHPHLTILVDDENEIIPENIGIVSTCMAEVHTHDVTGTIHLESLDVSRKFTLGQFFVIWGKPIEREGYTLHATINGEPLEKPEELILKDSDSIVLEYERAPLD